MSQSHHLSSTTRFTRLSDQGRLPRICLARSSSWRPLRAADVQRTSPAAEAGKLAVRRTEHRASGARTMPAESNASVSSGARRRFTGCGTLCEATLVMTFPKGRESRRAVGSRPVQLALGACTPGAKICWSGAFELLFINPIAARTAYASTVIDDGVALSPDGPHAPEDFAVACNKCKGGWLTLSSRGRPRRDTSVRLDWIEAALTGEPNSGRAASVCCAMTCLTMARWPWRSGILRGLYTSTCRLGMSI